MSTAEQVDRPTSEDYIWATIMLAPTASVCTSILAGEPVRIGDLNPHRLHQALRGGLRHVDEYITVTTTMLNAILEVGADDSTQAPDWIALRDMPYPAYLETTHWQHIRRDAIRRAGGHCQLCNAKPLRHYPLDVHHRTYERRGAERPEDVIVLCRRCHETFHSHTPPRSRPPRPDPPR